MVTATATIMNAGPTSSSTLSYSIPAMATTTTMISITVVGLTMVRKWWNNKRQKKPFETVPMPPMKWTLLGHLDIFTRFFKETCCNPNARPLFVDDTNEHGQVGIWLGPRKAIVVTHADDAKTILTAEYYRKGSPLVVKHVQFFLGRKNIGVLQGKEWRQNRSAIIRSLSPSSTLENSRIAMLEVANRFVTACKDKIQNSGSKKKEIVSPIEDYMKMITIDVFSKASLDVDLGCTQTLQASPIAIAFDHLLDELTTRILDPFNPFNFSYSLPTQRNRKHKQERTVVRTFLEDLVRDRRTRQVKEDDKSSQHQSTKNDVLSNLIQVENESLGKTENTTSFTADDEKVMEETLDDTLMALLFAGYDTTSITLTYAFWCISQHPNVQTKCLEEIQYVLSSSSATTKNTTDNGQFDISDLSYCRAVILETLRLYPPAGMTTRFLTKPITLKGNLTIPKGSAAMVYIEHIQRNERYFPLPDQFIPERWVQRIQDQSSKQQQQLWEERFPSNSSTGTDNVTDSSKVPAADRSAFLAFSAGQRICPGMKFALQESTLVLATLLKDLKFESLPGYVLQPVRKGVIQHPHDGIPMKISIRQ